MSYRNGAEIASGKADPPFTLAALTAAPRWVAWQTEERKPGEKPTKLPYAPFKGGGMAEADNPATWGTRAAAEAREATLPKPFGTGGVGIELGDLGDGTSIGGVDLDSCRSPDGTLEPWATEILDLLDTYAETSPSGGGVKAFFRYETGDLPLLQAAMGTPTGKSWKHGNGAEHPPGIELYLCGRYFAVTDQHHESTPLQWATVSLSVLLKIIQEIGPAFRSAAAAPDRSSAAFRIGMEARRAGKSFEEMCQAIEADPATKDWYKEKGVTQNKRHLYLIWEKATPDKPDMSMTGAATRAPPRLPLEHFGGQWAKWIRASAEAAACPPDYVAIPLLATASALIGNARWAQATPGWCEPPHLWAAVVGDSGHGKSPGSDCILGLVVPKLERKMQGDFPDKLREWQAANEAAKAAKEAWQSGVREARKKKSENPEPFPPEAPEQPQAPRLRQNDVTIERMATLLATAAPKGLLVVRDELAGWFLGMNSYNDSGRQFWIEAYGGRPYRVERQKHPEPIDVPRLAVAVTGGTQPDKLAELFRDPDDGLLARMLWAWPEPLPFRLGREHSETEFAIEALDKLRLLDLAPGDTPAEPGHPVMIRLANDALPAMETFGRDMQALQQQAGGLMRSSYGKARGQALRLSLVLTYLWWCAAEGYWGEPPAEITASALKSACELVRDYFMPMAERVYGDAATPPDERNAATLARWILKARPSEVHVREMQRTHRLPGLREAAAIYAACDLLVDAGWLMPPRPGGREGRTRSAYLVRGEVFEAADGQPTLF